MTDGVLSRWLEMR